jgi:hypothetical protein
MHAASAAASQEPNQAASAASADFRLAALVLATVTTTRTTVARWAQTAAESSGLARQLVASEPQLCCDAHIICLHAAVSLA